MSNVIINTPYAVSTKTDGSMKKSDGTVDRENIKQFLASTHLPSPIICMEQVHGGEVEVVSNTDQEIIHGVDGLITDKNKISLGVVTADCLPIMLFDPVKKVIGVAHAGRNGLLKNILKNTIGVFKREFLSKPKDIFVTIGPSIERDCYEVETSLVESFEKAFSWFDNSFFKPSDIDHIFLDLRKIALHCLLKEGILEKHITVSDVCTKHATDSLYSYRAGDKTDRFVSIISL